MKQARPKLIDVAQLAGVSAATVSRVLSQPDLVSAETRDTVNAAIAAIGYRPNQAARNLRHSRTGGIVALVPNLANPFFAQILSGIASVLRPAGYNLLVADTVESGARSVLDYAEPSRADGLIVLDGALPLSAFDGVLPVVEACEWVPGLSAPRVKIDNRAAAGLAIAHLLGLGHRRIGHVMGPRGNVLTEARLAGVEEALSAAALPAASLYQGDFGLDSGRATGAEWLAEDPATRPTAVFLSSDTMACGFLAEVQRHGIRVPQDLSVIGFDDIDLVAHVSPSLTTIRQPRIALGRRAAERLLERLSGAGSPGDTILPVELVVRSSTGPVPTA